MVFCIGLTGTIACGKSTVALCFKNLGIQIIDSDYINKQLTMKGTEAYSAIVKHFGIHILNQEEQLDRTMLRELIFSNQEERLWLEQLLHPKIQKQIELEVTQSSSSYCVVEIPLLKNKKNHLYINRVLLVVSSIERQVERLTRRDQCSMLQAHKIIATQPRLEDRLSFAEDVLVNKGSLEELKQEVAKLHQRYLQLKEAR
jgi:dephospho-CoA kinase